MGLIQDLEEKLKGGKFRMLNEKLYLKKSVSHEEMQKYHDYYKHQVQKWPLDPKIALIEKIKKLKKIVKIADLGCGDMEIAKHFKEVVSFDRYPQNDSIIKCSLEEIKSESNQFDVAICCLSLMMRYISKVLKEVNRILKIDGLYYLAEIRSRISSNRTFISSVEKFGFKLIDKDLTNTHFVIFTFQKTKDFIPQKRMPEVKLSPCLYKKR